MSEYGGYIGTYAELFEALPPEAVAVGESTADVLSPARGFIGGFDFTMQVQVGCPGVCLFCYVPSSQRLAPTAVTGPEGREWGFHLRNKRDAVAKFRTHLEAGELADKTLYWSGVTDPYAAPPTVTRALWQSLLDTPPTLRPRRLCVQTRFRPDRDAALMADYNHSTPTADGGPPLLVSFSIGTDREALIRAWERATPSFAARMRAIATLREAGIFVVATLSPFGLWDDLKGTLHQFQAMGVAYITALFFKENTSASNTPPRFLAFLRRHHPELLDPYWQAARVAEMRATYGAQRVLVGKAGFSSLVAPQLVAPAQTNPPSYPLG